MNTIRMIGGITEKFNYLYEFEGECFYSSYIECKRSSGVLDTLPLVVSENAVLLRILQLVTLWTSLDKSEQEMKKVK